MVFFNYVYFVVSENFVKALAVAVVLLAACPEYAWAAEALPTSLIDLFRNWLVSLRYFLSNSTDGFLVVY